MCSLEAGAPVTTDVRANVWDLMVEGGYDVSVSESVVLRPKLGLGLGSMQIECFGAGCNQTSTANWAVAPGLKLIFFGRSVSFLLDARFATVFSDENAQAIVLAVGLGGAR